MGSEKSESAGRRREQPVSDSKRGAQWSVPEQSVVVESGSCSQRNRQQAALAAQPTAVVRLGLVHAQSTLCSSKRQSVLQVQSTLQVPVNFEPLADMQG